MQNMGYWSQNKPQFVRNVRFMIDKYLGDDFLKGKLANNEIITEADLRAAFPRDEFPIVHGEEIKQHSSLKIHQTANAWLDNQTEKAWKQLADVPADVLSRHPLFLQMHQHEMENLIRQQYHYKMQNFGEDTITPKEWEAFLDDFQHTLDKFQVPAPEQAELRAIVASTYADIVVGKA